MRDRFNLRLYSEKRHEYVYINTIGYEDYKSVCAYISSTDNISKDRYLRLKKAIKELTE